MSQFSTQLGVFSTVGMNDVTRKGVEAGALLVTRSARTSIRAGSGGDSVLSNVGRGARVGARYDIQGRQNPTALVRATGPLRLLDNPTRPHRIGAKVKKGRSQSSRAAFYNAIFGGGSGYGSAKPLRTPYGPRYSVQHPGTRGKRTFWKGVTAAKPFVRLEFNNGVRRGMRRYFG